MDAYGRKIAQGGHAPFPRNLRCYQQTEPDVKQSASRGTWIEKPYAPYFNIRCSLPWDVNWGRSDWMPANALPLGTAPDDSRTYEKNETALRVLPTDYRDLPYTIRPQDIRNATDKKLIQFSHQGRAI
jgi:hypothetical protein